MLHTYIAPLIAFALASGAFDAYETLKGLKKGSGLEDNSTIVFLSKLTNPTAAVVIYNLAKTAAIASLSLSSSYALLGGSVAGLIADGAGHIQAGVKWRYLNNGGQIDRTKPVSAWQKFLGMGWD